MIKKIVLGFVTYCLLLMAFSALTVEVNAQKKVPKKARNLKKAGDGLFNKRDYQQAINKYAEAIIVADNYSDAHFWKGYSHYNLYQIKASQNDAAGEQSELTLALDELNAAYRQGYEPLEIYKVRWYINYLKQNYDAALDDLQSGLQLDSTNLTFQSGLADVYYAKKAYREAVDAYVRVVDQIPNNGNAYYNIANSNYNLGNTSAQKVAAQQAIAKGTQFVGESYFLIGDAFQKERNLTGSGGGLSKIS